MSIFFYIDCKGMGVRNVRDDVWSGPYRGAGQEVPALSAGDREGRPYGGMVRDAVGSGTHGSRPTDLTFIRGTGGVEARPYAYLYFFAAPPCCSSS